MKKYFKTKREVLKFINSDKYWIIEMTPIKKTKKLGFIKIKYTSSYCVLYDKMI